MASRDEQSEAFLSSDTLSDDFFSSIVEHKLNIKRDSFKIRLALLTPATGSNENFVSVVYRAKIKIDMIETKERKNIDVIIKALLTTIPEFKQFSVFPRERFMYEDIISSFENIWLERAHQVVEFAPKCLKIETDPYEIIALDDLKANGYQMLDRKIGLTAAQTKSALTKLAQFHAAGAVRYVKDGTLQNFLVRKLMMPPDAFSEDSPMAKGFTAIYRNFIECLRSYGDCNEYADKIATWDREKFMNCWITVAEPMKCGFETLTHGDFWLNNMMFKLNDAMEPEDTIMLDFQGNAWASPSLDFHYFITSSVRDEIKVSCYDEFVKHYYSVLVESLEKLQYELHIPTLEEFYEDLLEKAGLAVQSLFFIMFVTRYESSEVIDMGELFSKGESMSKEFYERIYCNETFKAAVRSWLPFLEERGYLDSLLPNEQMKIRPIQNGI